MNAIALRNDVDDAAVDAGIRVADLVVAAVR